MLIDYPVATAPGSDPFAGHKMGRIDPICILFVLQKGTILAVNDPNYGPKTLQIEKFCRKLAGQIKKIGLTAFFPNNFPVPRNTWDKPGTRLGHATSGTLESRSENGEFRMLFLLLHTDS